MSDHVSNCISSIQTAVIAKKLRVTVQNTKFIANILQILTKLGFLNGFVIKDQKQILVLLKYKGKGSSINKVNVLSRPGKRLYYKVKDIKVKMKRKGLGHYVLTTNLGVLTDEQSNSSRLGGEVLLKIR